ncbi:TetR/AcrR family transcriptional regulator [Microbacterium sp. LRZ72]|uniref:TetR/AcrR family transcriptional regulator n=1 Tax=Microbacterium sp. LRZ72 TaxID=2942481 RepID=UPI0029A610FC|nr:TetR/AcrR family transcriptional regulator [Microbacterium sp. LRZ72]MDX2375414.1 TetR/AcrR family transcriptional regulator [Microbacterium sp. LRZ72]
MTTSSDGGHSTRDRILIAAAQMLGQDPTARLSVRAVAARAGVSTGSLRHFFPRQSALLHEVLAGIYQTVQATDPIGDLSRPAEERLVACLQQALAQVGTGEQARQTWRTMHRAYIESEPTTDAGETYLTLERAGRRRIEGWLRALTDEGALTPGDTENRARYLSTVLNGLAIERALPADGPRLAAETATLQLAVTAVFADDARGRDDVQPGS